ncbi:uncharacterized protein EI90DRAFT_3046795 [Cantharellus anzutake]|uniref:uncharacterized protein n=1 Tax=Cantharellus anzutake TaxID=1750568 RepID=UPI001907E3BD|nr:uncharacterized protein EI90DRAFT_3046795 [Cantharellus anzutake]KAF8335687.1 hypothetical protein EI90DRAFT_3046795 [Cantharellus anzutake]
MSSSPSPSPSPPPPSQQQRQRVNTSGRQSMPGGDPFQSPSTPSFNLFDNDPRSSPAVRGSFLGDAPLLSSKHGPSAAAQIPHHSSQINVQSPLSSPTNTVRSSPSINSSIQPNISTPRRRAAAPGSGSSSIFATPSSLSHIRSDHAILTAFDPADKELYNLWAPKV